ncbi:MULTISPECIES: threonine/serine ThrE exporter family protein [unclassified Gordonia (in: high G+C Gram-positive bacteria)]
MSDDAVKRPESADPDDMLSLITEVGEALNSSSYPVPLTQQVLHEICTTYDYDATTEVFATYIIALDRQRGRAAMANSSTPYRFDQIADTETLVHRLRREPIPVPDALHKLRAIADAPPPIHPLARIAGYMLMALGFAMCFRMSPLASVAAVVLSIPIAAVLLWSGTKPAIAALMPVLLTFLAALPIALWSVHGGFDDPVRLAVIPVVTLIPGAALTTALIELTTGDMIAGSTRLVSALIVLLSMAFGFALALDVAGLTSVHLQDLTSEQAPSWVLWLAGPVFAVGNILYFCTPQRLWVWTIGLTFGTFWLNNVTRLVMLPAFAGGIALGVTLLVAWVVSDRAKGHPSTLVMYLPPFWLMVPGSMGFVAISGVITEDHELSGLGTNAALSLLSMAICMMIATVLAPLVIRLLNSWRPRP